MNTMNPHKFNAVALLLFSSLISVANAAPPDVQVPNSGLLMRETRERPVLPEQRPEVNIENDAQKQRPPMPTQNNLQVNVQYFSFHGNSAFNNAQLQSLLIKYKGRPIGFNELQSAAATITDFYRQAGFLVAYAYLPAQSIKNGIVEIEILEGHLDGSHLEGNSVELVGNTRINKAVIQRFLSTQPAGSTVTDADLSRLSLLINDLPGIESKAVLSPGKKTGTTALSIKAKEAPLLTGYISSDNHGLYSTGYYRFDGGVNINDPFGLGDQLSLRAQTTETGNSVAGWANYNLPINGYGTRLGINFSELHYTLGRSFSVLNADGLARTLGTSLTHPLYLSRDARLTGILHYEHRWMQDNIGVAGYVNPRNARQLDVGNFAFSGHLYDKLLPAGGLTQTYLSASVGNVHFTDQAAALNDSATGLNSKGTYHKFYWQLNRTQNLWSDDKWGEIGLYANFAGQVASKNIDSSERISLGGPNAIRAYPVGEGSADEGWYFNGEARYGLPSFGGVIPGQLQLIGFIDTGFARMNAIALGANNSRHLTGYGFGINWLGVHGITLRTSLAWRDVNTTPTSDPTRGNGPQGYFQLTKSF